MARVFLVFVVVQLSVVAALCQLECNKPNEEKRCVTECPPAKTCDNRNVAVLCTATSEVCQDACRCKDGFYRNPGGDCVTEDDCEKCNGQNEFYSCRIQPDETCASRVDGQSAQANKTENDCTCYCRPGTARDENDVCVPYDQCNKPCTGVGESKDYCPVDCASDNCPKSEQAVSCPRPEKCANPQCKCRFNYRRAENGTCIPTRACPPFECSKPNEEYNSCPPLCPNGYCSEATSDGRCPAVFGNIGIVLQCSPRCRCKSGYFWNDDKICVPYAECPGKGPTTASPTTLAEPEQ